MSRTELDPGSFRDPDSRVVVAPEGVLRALSPRGLDDFEALAASGLLEQLVDERRLVATARLDGAEPVAAGLAEPAAAVLRHERIPVVSYPYEWPFGMLRDAALLQLDVLAAALDHGLILKDATPYNVQWRGTAPVFIDVGSFERLREGEPWAAYRQFCTLFLYPLMLQAYKGVPFQPWLRGRIDGIEPGELASLMSFRDRFRRGVLLHVVLHARLERRERARGAATGEVKDEVKRAGFRKELIVANVRRLRSLVAKLRWRPPSSAWTGYGATTSYSEGDAARKEEFVRRVAGARAWGTAWDLGCNDGRFARLVASHADHVVAADADPRVVEGLYGALAAEGDERVLPLVLDFADPSPGLGWRAAERRPLEARSRPDLVLVLALLHHLAIGRNMPLGHILDWLRDLRAELVIEFPGPEDPMVRRLVAAKRAGTHDDYRRDAFERLLAERFDVGEREELAGGARTLYRARPRA